MSLDPAEFDSHGFRQDADSGLFYELDRDGRIVRFGFRAADESGEGKGHEVEILTRPADGVEAVERSWTVGVHPHPDADPTIGLDAWALEVRQRILTEASHVLLCSFCGKTSGEVARLIAGLSAYICNECVGLCNEILGDGDVSP